MPCKINLEICIDNRITTMDIPSYREQSFRETNRKKIYQKTSINSYTSPTVASPGSSSELYLAGRRGTRGAAKTREAPFSSRLCHRSTSGYLLLKIHPLGSRLARARGDRTGSSRSPSSSRCRFSIGARMQQSLI